MSENQESFQKDSSINIDESLGDRAFDSSMGKPVGIKNFGNNQPVGIKNFGNNQPVGIKNFGNNQPVGFKNFGDNQVGQLMSNWDNQPQNFMIQAGSHSKNLMNQGDSQSKRSMTEEEYQPTNFMHQGNNQPSNYISQGENYPSNYMNQIDYPPNNYMNLVDNQPSNYRNQVDNQQSNLVIQKESQPSSFVNQEYDQEKGTVKKPASNNFKQSSVVMGQTSQATTQTSFRGNGNTVSSERDSAHENNEARSEDAIAKIISVCQYDKQCSGHANCIRTSNRAYGFCRCLPGYHGNGISCWEDILTGFSQIALSEEKTVCVNLLAEEVSMESDIEK
ncbi:hypothetical protein TNIN_18551 [Trichonephila inaurata madagascariensis]|uniref:EGF-like domain-containing protein n=1 Tax=Trichonephila inaurata madagascariensis TaxID=2747483 RepID=A0A8X7CSG8_9ARAC|nr:hypothetical protein TNIN_18551 [Trichonephila inaurata madagascariensis]